MNTSVVAEEAGGSPATLSEAEHSPSLMTRNLESLAPDGPALSHVTRRWWLLLLPALAIVLAALAFGLPFLAVSDATTPLTHEQATRLKARASHQFDFPPLRLQVTEGAAASDNPDAGRGQIAVRSLFGIRTGTVDQAGAVITSSRSTWEVGLWLGFAGLEVSILFVFIALWHTGDDYYDDEEPAANSASVLAPPEGPPL